MPRSPLTAGALLLHLLIVAALLSPLRRMVTTPLLDRELVYLAPPDREQTPGREHGELTSQVPTSAAIPGASAGATLEPNAPPVKPGNAAELTSRMIVTKPAPAVRQELAMTELEVDSAVVRDPSSAAPAYPPTMLSKGITGLAAVRFVVDTLGAVDTLSLLVVTATHAEFAAAVRQALPLMRFRPAIQHGHRVRQWVEQTFHFRITKRDTTRIAPDH